MVSKGRWYEEGRGRGFFGQITGKSVVLKMVVC